MTGSRSMPDGQIPVARAGLLYHVAARDSQGAADFAWIRY